MFGATFKHSIIRKCVIIFGNLFNDISIERRDNTETRVQTLKVPLAYGPRSKFIEPNLADQRTKRPVGIQLPRIGFEIVSYTRASPKQQNRTIRHAAKIAGNPDLVNFQWIGVPYTLGFKLSVYSFNAEDAADIIEQILPYFAPDWTVSAILIPEMHIQEDVVVELSSVNQEDEYIGAMEKSRVLIWDMMFNVTTRFYGPVHKGGLIKRTQIDYHVVPGHGPVTNREIRTTPRQERYVLIPGLKADGTPTTDPNEAIPYQEVHIDDNWGYADSLTLFDDGKKYDPVTGQDIPAEDE